MSGARAYDPRPRRRRVIRGIRIWQNRRLSVDVCCGDLEGLVLYVGRRVLELEMGQHATSSSQRSFVPWSAGHIDPFGIELVRQRVAVADFLDHERLTV